MINHTVFAVIFCLQGLLEMGQSANVKVARLLYNSDSVVLISHVTTLENHDKDEGILDSSDGVIIFRPRELSSFFKGNDINPAIIVQKKLLSKSDVVRLSDIIKNPVKRSDIGYVPLCFEPHHAILIYSKNNFSFIDICFHCSDLVNSLDIDLSNSDFDNYKWTKIKAFFNEQGLTYELDIKR